MSDGTVGKISEPDGMDCFRSGSHFVSVISASSVWGGGEGRGREISLKTRSTNPQLYRSLPALIFQLFNSEFSYFLKQVLQT